MSDLTAPHVVDADTLTGELRPLRRAALSLGSNLGDRMELLQGAVDSLAETPGVAVVAVSPVYETEPVGGPEGQPAFLNAVLLLETQLSPQTLLERCQAVESAYGRVRTEHWGPRTLDLDVLVVGDLVVHQPDVTVPHPRIAERAFVLVPWADVDPDAQVPGLGTVGELRDRVGSDGVRRTGDELVVGR